MKAVVKRKFTKLKHELEAATAEMEVILQNCTQENKELISTLMWEKCEQAIASALLVKDEMEATLEANVEGDFAVEERHAKEQTEQLLKFIQAFLAAHEAVDVQ